MRSFMVWALWAALGLMVLDAGLEVRSGGDGARTAGQQQVLPSPDVTAMDGGDGTPPTPPPIR